MAIGDKKVFTMSDSGVELKVIALDNGDGTVSFTIESQAGSASADINALFWNDAAGGSEKIATKVGDSAKADNSLNMNGTKVDWDGSVGLSSTGLGKEGADKATFLTEGNSISDGLTLAVNFDSLDTIGIRATSVTGGTADGIKGVAAGFEFVAAPVVDDTPKDYFPDVIETGGIGYATFYFDATAGSGLENLNLDQKGTYTKFDDHGPQTGDGVFTVKVDGISGVGDFDDAYQGILNALVQKYDLPTGTEALGVALKAGNSEVYYEVTAPNPLDHIVTSNLLDATVNYGDLV